MPGDFNDKSEQVFDIIERMPQKFAIYTTGIVLSLVFILLLLGFTIQYPDTITGAIVINARYAPIKLVANTSGKIQLFSFKSKDDVKEGDYIAVLKNSANTYDVKKINDLLTQIKLDDLKVMYAFKLFPKTVSMGDMNVKYYTFLNTLQQLYNYQISNLFKKQQEGLYLQLNALSGMLANNKELEKTRKINMLLAKKIFERDSILLAEKVGNEDDADKSKISYLSTKENFQAIYKEILTDQQQIDDNNNKLQQIDIQKSDKEKQMLLDFLSAYDDLRDNIKAWEEKYVFKSPISGKVDFLKFLNNNQYVQSGEDIFTIVPKENEIIGQVELPAHGAGKAKVGQNVIIKLDSYPYEEFGSVHGIVGSISLLSNPIKVKDNTVDTYLVEVNLPNGLKTNYGSKLPFKYEIKGTADIISNQRVLIMRLFDNLKLAINKT